MDTSAAILDHLSTLGDRTRSRLLALLDAHELSVSEIQQVVQLPQSTVSRHLRILADEDWVVSRSEGTSRFYRISPELDEEALSLWGLVRNDLAHQPAVEADRERARAVLERRNDRSRAFFSESADRWDELRDELFGVGAARLPLFGLLDPGWVVADLGAGTGALARSLAPFVERVVAVDRSPEMLRAARERTAVLEGPGEVEYREGDLERLPVEDATVDLAVLALVLHHAPDPAAVVAEAGRILAPGGRLVVVDMRRHDRVEYRNEMGHLWPGFDAERIEGWMTDAGLGGVVARPLPPDPEASGPLLFVARGRRR